MTKAGRDNDSQWLREVEIYLGQNKMVMDAYIELIGNYKYYYLRDRRIEQRKRQEARKAIEGI